VARITSSSSGGGGGAFSAVVGLAIVAAWHPIVGDGTAGHSGQVTAALAGANITRALL
jgi:hypothetical protein